MSICTLVLPHSDNSVLALCKLYYHSVQTYVLPLSIHKFNWNSLHSGPRRRSRETGACFVLEHINITTKSQTDPAGEPSEAQLNRRFVTKNVKKPPRRDR